MITKRITEPYLCPQYVKDTTFVVADGADWNAPCLQVKKEGTEFHNVELKYEGSVTPGKWWRSIEVQADNVKFQNVTQYGLNYTPRVHQAGIVFKECKNAVLREVRSFRTSIHFGIWFEGVENWFMDECKSQFATMDGFKVDSKPKSSMNGVGYRCEFSKNGFQDGKPAGEAPMPGAPRLCLHFEERPFAVNSDGMDWATCQNCWMVDCKAFENYDGGFVIKNADKEKQKVLNRQNKLIDCEAYQNRTNGFQFWDVDDCQLESCVSYENGNGAHVYGRDCLVDIRAYNNRKAGISIDEKSSRCEFLIGQLSRNRWNVIERNARAGHILAKDRDELVRKRKRLK